MKILIVGQGIAGTVLCHVLKSKGADVTIADGRLQGRSSEVAAGIINPVTGKRFVKSWRFDTLFPAAERIYGEIEASLGVRVLESKPILRLLQSPEEINDWSARCAHPDYLDYLGETNDAGPWRALLKPGFSYGVIHKAARVHFPEVLASYREKAVQEGFFWETTLDYQQVPALLKSYDKVVFCEGFRAKENPFFPNLAWQLAKGEALLLRFESPEALHISDMAKKTSLITPLGNGLFWAGGSYQWHYPDLLPSQGERDYILQRLKEMIDAPFEIVSHVAGVRPSVKDRRPFLGQSAILPEAYIFNGLGTKGAILAPYWANHMAEYLLEHKALDPEVNVARNY